MKALQYAGVDTMGFSTAWQGYRHDPKLPIPPAEVRGLTVDEVARVTTATARRLFKLPEG